MHAEERNGHKGLVKPQLLVDPLNHALPKLVVALTCDHKRAFTNLGGVVASEVNTRLQR